MQTSLRNRPDRYHAYLAIPLLIGIALVLGTLLAGAITPQDALTLLTDGNARFRQGTGTRPNGTMARVEETAAGQHPFAVVLTCSDSRVPPELIFDRGIGDLFVVRTAGNVIDAVAIGSIEYAVEHLHVPRVVVLGHTRCGAVAAATAPEQADGSIGAILERIVPAIQLTRAAHPTLTGEAFLDAVAMTNAQQQALRLCAQSPIIAREVTAGKTTMISAMYDVRTGAVTISTTPVIPPADR